jgi:hypothetical protein
VRGRGIRWRLVVIRMIKMNRYRGIALFEILLLVSFAFAVAFILEAGVVSADFAVVGGKIVRAGSGNYASGTFSTQAEAKNYINKVINRAEVVTDGAPSAAPVPTVTVTGAAKTLASSTFYVPEGVDVSIPNGASGTLSSYTLNADGSAILNGQGLNGVKVTAKQMTSIQGNLQNVNVVGPQYTAQNPYKPPLIGGELVGTTAHLVQGLSWSLIALGATQMIGNFAGFSKDNTNALTYAALGAIWTHKLLIIGAEKNIFGTQIGAWLKGTTGAIPGSALIGIGVGVVMFLCNA